MVEAAGLTDLCRVLDGVCIATEVAIELYTIHNFVLERSNGLDSVLNAAEVDEAVAGLFLRSEVHAVLLHDAVRDLSDVRK